MEARLERDGLSSFGDWPLHIYNEQVSADRTLLGLVRKRVLRLLVRRGLLCEEPGESPDEPEAPPLHALYAASVRQRVQLVSRLARAILAQVEASAR